MSRVFRRPMFRKGGNVGEGIMTGIRDNYEVGGSAKERLAKIAEQYPSTGFDPLTQFLIQGGLNLASQPSTGGVLSDIATAAKEPTAQLFKGMAEKGNLARELALAGEQLDIQRDFEKENLEFEGQIKKDVAKIQQRGALDIKKDYLDQVYDIKRKEAGGNQELLKQIEEDYQKDLNLYIVRGFDVSDIYNVVKGDEIQSTILQQAEDYVQRNLKDLNLTGEDDPNYGPTLLAVMARFTKDYGEKLKEGFATGGRVGFAMGTPQNMNQTMNQDVPKPPVTVGERNVTSGPQMDITYDELRTRLPQEISDEVVKLLSTSYEALADFAELRTQADVDAFNSRYGVNLILPQEA